MSDLNPFLLAAVTPDPDPRLLPLLRAKPDLASAQDAHGYSLLHAAASYSHVDLLRSLVNEFHVDVNLRDEDGETCLFVAETVEVAKCLVEELHVDLGAQNDEGMTAVEKFEAEQEYPDVAAYLREHSSSPGANRAGPVTNGGQHPPPLPPNVSINIDTAPDPTANNLDQEPDPEFRRRIEELASRDNFHTEEGQRELRDLITDAVRGVGSGEREVRRRTE
ncbi:hypothetical protein HRR83_006558 [Exophiala dermatitidis]|uniref:Uncharacterized protein n=2 Tax=Exophiala dermatitidis TaxID=5970 RepID=H6BWK2_EXODN|nr:uncharacterized protein HMPREF1120_04167 [Exophiala dermatitidis NIH/UT8656]KAJ4511318.1 hypothetical protein HRR75_005243 [Exophiala dermatitidis]EHY56063.1 hypothetical protein HMPREF1120_04167 [Exophiala dermatitidis NIH/UT8656]KAJ4514060.1 hypothetical protein HRR74_005718 [Exophiala dermatitidis]KAJ4515457.1 hypothetical protein HRR73_005289 [Exophiala dermatitidis]KAJ4536485.1 hypothetical protein HRR77_007402 [Exophiala dermatitidis]